MENSFCEVNADYVSMNHGMDVLIFKGFCDENRVTYFTLLIHTSILDKLSEVDYNIYHHLTHSQRAQIEFYTKKDIIKHKSQHIWDYINQQELKRNKSF
jgi:hypothetical protein